MAMTRTMEATHQASCMVNNYSLNPLSKSQIIISTHFIHQQNNISSSSSSFTSSFSLAFCKRSRQLQKKLRAAFIDYNNSNNNQRKAMAEMPVKFKLTALVTVKNTMTIFHWLEYFNNSRHKGSVVLQLISTETDPMTMNPKLSGEATIEWSKNFKTEEKLVTYKVEFMVDANFGVPGAITVCNKYQEEFFLESITIENVIYFPCNSWIQPVLHDDHADKRNFFTNKAYLPCQTPSGLRELREMELNQLKGDGKGIRKLSNRIYDYDTYKDLGNPDKGIKYSRPIMGGQNHPYPRRCRTGRPLINTDDNTESPVNESMPMYVPRDEALENSKRKDMFFGKLKGVIKNLIPVLKNSSIQDFSEMNRLYKKRNTTTIGEKSMECWKIFSLQYILSKIAEFIAEIYKFDPPKGISISGEISYLRDDEFGRLTLRGMNPLNIERLEVFPPVSKLNPSIYGPQESAFKEEHIIGHLDGMSVQQAIKEHKLFILDYHDIYLPFLDQINELNDRKGHATRTIFFLSPLGTLKPISIELSSSPFMNNNRPSKQVLTPPVDSTTYWLWQLGKAHVCCNDSGAHQLINHWLRSHACMEPFIIAANRQLSVMHPIYKLLKPHMRGTLAINSLAREFLINANGIIESFFSPHKHCMEITQSAYRDWWRFDMEGLPADLIRRGLAIPDPTEDHGLRLIIEDYPYANDGLLIWFAIEKLVKTYVNYYYPEASLVQFDTELQAWYKEFINLGHADISHANWWPKLSTQDDLSSILTTLIWVVSAQHAALNFGQYDYGGYVPIRSPHLRKLVPMQGSLEYADFLQDPQRFFLSSFPSLPQTTHFMSVLDILSTHAVDEEYIGDRKDLSIWSAENEIVEALYRFSMEIKKIEIEIQKRNSNPKFRNRCGAGIAPYDLLLPSSNPGVTGRGVPNSVTI